MAMSMQSLSDELLVMVLNQLSQADPQSLLRLCLTSRRFCRLASSFVYRSVTMPRGFKWPSDNNLMLESEDFTFVMNTLSFCRYIIVENAMNWPFFAILLARMHRLESIRWRFWNSQFPAEINTILQSVWPDAKIYVERLNVGHRTDEIDVQQRDLSILKSLVECSNIHSIDVRNDYDHPVTMRWLKDVLLSSPRLEILRITLPTTTSGKVDWACDNLGVYDMCVEPGESLSPLTTLVYEARLPAVTENITIPASFFNWSKIRHLELRGHKMDSFIRSVKENIISLDTLILEFFCTSADFRAGAQLLDDLISRIRGLKSLTLVNPVDQLPVSTICLHGETLERLTIRHPRAGSDPYSMVIDVHPYDPTSLDELRISCPHISSLTLDIMIEDYVPYDFVEALARFHNLTTLRLYFSFNYTYSVPAALLSHITSDRLMARDIFSYLCSNKAGLPLERVEMMMGSFSRFIPDAGLINKSERPSILFVCRRNSAGNIVVEDDVSENESPAWDGYFGMDRLNAKVR